MSPNRPFRLAPHALLGAALLVGAAGGCHLVDSSNAEVRRPALLRVSPSSLVVAETLHVGVAATATVATVREPTCARVAGGLEPTSPTPAVYLPASGDQLAAVEAGPEDEVLLQCSDRMLVDQPRAIAFTPAAAGPLVIRVIGWAVPGAEPGSVATPTRPPREGDEIVAVSVVDTVLVVR